MSRTFWICTALLLALPVVVAFQGKLVAKIEDNPQPTGVELRVSELERQVLELQAAVAELQSTEK